MDRILFVNPFGIGDVLFSTPLVRLVRETYPQAFIGYVCNRRTAPILLSNPRINQIFIFEKDEYRAIWERSRWACVKALGDFFNKIKRHRFEVLFDLSLNDRFSFFAMWFIPQRLGFNYKGRGRFLTKRLDIAGYEGKHVIEYYMDLARFVGLTPQVYPTEFPVPAVAQAWAAAQFDRQGLRNNGPVIGLIPGGGASWGGAAWVRRWLDSYYAALGDLVVERLGARIVLFGGGAEDEAIAQRVQRGMHHQAVNLVEQGDLTQFAAMLQRCAVVVAHDCGPLHIAVSQRVPTVGIYGPVDERVYGPYPPDARYRILSYDPGCRPCYRKFRMPPCPIGRRCLSQVTPEHVVEAVESLFKTHAHCPVLQ